MVNRDHSWIHHAGGAARLMQLRGARRCYESAFEYSMFLACRGAIVSPQAQHYRGSITKDLLILDL